MNCSIFTVGNLEKVLPHVKPTLTENSGTTLSGEKFSFQIVAVPDVCLMDCRLHVTADIPFTVYSIGLVPARFSYQPDHDDYILGEGLTLFPDVLKPYGGEEFFLSANVYTAFTVSFTAENAGEHVFKIKLTGEKGVTAETEYSVKVYSSRPAENDLVVTNWMHYDCISRMADAEPFTDKFYRAAENYIRAAAEHGQTMLYIPMFTPPLDTAVGSERLTVQAVGVTYKKGKYSFNFENFDKLTALADKCGIKYFELSHMFSQWGAEFCPKIMAETDTGYRRIFGWDTSSEGDEYNEFLAAFLPALTAHLDKKGITERCYLHISDEPAADHLERYGRLKNKVKSLAPSLELIDALSEFDFYEKGYVDLPIVCLSHEKPYFEHGAKFWVYYCCGPYTEHYTNRFMNMPSLRTRILGIQLYLTGIKGFLHWGFNFYNSGLSKWHIDPYTEPSAGGTFPAGDGYVVYPAKDGEVYSSIRLEAFSSGIDDYRACVALERKIGREAVVKLLNESGYQSNFTEYDTDPARFTALRNKINELLG